MSDDRLSYRLALLTGFPQTPSVPELDRIPAAYATESDEVIVKPMRKRTLYANTPALLIDDTVLRVPGRVYSKTVYDEFGNDTQLNPEFWEFYAEQTAEIPHTLLDTDIILAMRKNNGCSTTDLFERYFNEHADQIAPGTNIDYESLATDYSNLLRSVIRFEHSHTVDNHNTKLEKRIISIDDLIPGRLLAKSGYAN